MAIEKVQAPRFGIAAQFSVSTPPMPVDPFVSDSDPDPTTAAPLHLPVTSCGDGLPGQHLSPATESV